jgi:diguanylate cyclase (GGDEF)-like protein
MSHPIDSDRALTVQELRGSFPLLEHLPCPALWIGPDFEVRWSNRAARGAYGEGGRTCFRRCHGYLVPCDEEGETCPKEEAEASGRAVAAEHLHETRSGFAVFRVTAVPVEGSGILELHAPLGTGLTADPVTGTYTRHIFELLAHRQIAFLDRIESPWTVVLVDLDHLKEINDAHGHAAGDAALATVAEAIERTVRTTDTVGRIGGDEICVLLPATVEVEAELLVERIRQALHHARLPEPFTDLSVSASFGVHRAKPDEDLEDALAGADEALYAAKDAGRDGMRTR